MSPVAKATLAALASALALLAGCKPPETSALLGDDSATRAEKLYAFKLRQVEGQAADNWTVDIDRSFQPASGAQVAKVPSECRFAPATGTARPVVVTAAPATELKRDPVKVKLTVNLVCEPQGAAAKSHACTATTELKRVDQLAVACPGPLEAAAPPQTPPSGQTGKDWAQCPVVDLNARLSTMSAGITVALPGQEQPKTCLATKGATGKAVTYTDTDTITSLADKIVQAFQTASPSPKEQSLDPTAPLDVVPAWQDPTTMAAICGDRDRGQDDSEKRACICWTTQEFSYARELDKDKFVEAYQAGCYVD